MKIFFLALTLFALPAVAQAKPEIYQKDGLAIGGTDPVAYFTDKAPKMGSEKWTLNWSGATWRFTSEEHRDQFRADPERYAPQFGGWCAYAMAFGRKATTVPEAWSIVDGKLYLNYSLDVREKWQADSASFIKKANEFWPKLKNS